MSKLKKSSVCAAVTLAVWVGYMMSQQPKVWCNQQWAGIMLTKGGYRSWTMRFCDGEAFIDGKMQPIVITTNGYRKGCFSWPQFRHVDIRKLGLAEN